MVARELLLLLLFAFQTWTPAEALECSNSLQQTSSTCESTTGYCYLLASSYKVSALACDPDDSSLGLSPVQDLPATCREAEKQYQATPIFTLYKETGLCCFFSPSVFNMFCCGRDDRSNSMAQSERALGRYLQEGGLVPFIPFLPRAPTTKSTTTTSTSSTTTTIQTRPTTTTTATTRTTTTTSPTTTTTTPTTTPTTTTSPTTTMTSPTTITPPTTAGPPQTATESPDTTTTTSSHISAISRSTASSTSSAESTTSSGAVTSDVSIQCYEVDHLINNRTTSDRECSSSDRFCLIAVGSNDSYASGCVDSSGMAKVNEMLETAIDYSVFCQRLTESEPNCDNNTSSIRCERHATKSDGVLNICCTNAKENTLEIVREYEDENCIISADTNAQNDERHSLMPILVPIAVLLILLLLIILAIFVVVRRKQMKAEKKKDRKKGKKRFKKQGTVVISKNTVDTRPLPPDNTTMGLVRSTLGDFDSTTVNAGGAASKKTRRSADSARPASRVAKTSSPFDENSRGTPTTSTNKSISRSRNGGGAKTAKSPGRNSSGAPSYQTTPKNSPNGRSAKGSTSKMKQKKSTASQMSRNSSTTRRSSETTPSGYNSKEIQLTLTPKTSRGGSRQQAEEAATFKI